MLSVLVPGVAHSFPLFAYWALHVHFVQSVLTVLSCLLPDLAKPLVSVVQEE